MRDDNKSWEYLVRSFGEDGDQDHLLIFHLDEQGSQEWELVAFDFAKNRAIFKRHKNVSSYGYEFDGN